MRTVIIVVALMLLAYGGLLLANDPKNKNFLDTATLVVLFIVAAGAFFSAIFGFIFAKRPSDYR